MIYSPRDAIRAGLFIRYFLSCRAAAAGFVCIAINVSLPVQAQSTTTPPPPALNEPHGDWSVVCSPTGEAKLNCTMLQRQANDQGQQLLAIELHPRGPAMTGTIILPFGLDLPAGVKLQVDELAPSKPFAFFTCVYGGCVVPLSLDEVTTAAVRAGNQLKVFARANDGTDVAMAVSLRGATSAADRTASIDGQPASSPIPPAPAKPTESVTEAPSPAAP